MTSTPSSPNPPVLVVGGTGHLGGRVIDQLLDRGKTVRALVRPSSDASKLEAKGVQIARGDMLDLSSLVAAMTDADAVITTAAGYARRDKNATQIDTIGNANLAQAAATTGVRRFVQAHEHPHLRPDSAGAALLAQEARRGQAGRLGLPVRVAAARRLPRPDRADG